MLTRCHETAVILLAHGAHPELPLFSGLTALHLAAMKGDGEMVRILLAGGAIIDGRSRYGRTPFHWAALKGRVEVMQELLAHGADHEARDVSGRTPHEWAIAESMAHSLHASSSRKDTTMSTHSIPVGAALLGRVLNSNGEPIDHKGSLADAMHRPLYEPDTKRTRARDHFHACA